MGVLYFFIVGMAVCLTSCKEDSTIPPEYENLNAPVTTNLTNNFTYSIIAKNYSGTTTNDLYFLSDSLLVTLTTSTYSSGQAIVELSDSLHNTIFSDTVKSNKTVVITQGRTVKPKYCKIEATNLSAKLVFVVLGQ